ncbi:MAG: DUF2190 family protein [Glycocaulis sp.]
MKNYVQPGRTLTVPAPALVISGGVVIAGRLKGVANGDAAIGDPVDVTVEGVFELAKVAAESFAVGDPVYFDASAELATSDDEDNADIGYAVEAAGAGAASVRVRFG